MEPEKIEAQLNEALEKTGLELCDKDEIKRLRAENAKLLAVLEECAAKPITCSAVARRALTEEGIVHDV